MRQFIWKKSFSYLALPRNSASSFISLRRDIHKKSGLRGTFSPGISATKSSLNDTGAPKNISFNDPAVSYKDKTFKELLRSFTIFSLCSSDILVDNQAKILHWARRIMGRTLFRKLMKSTIYGQFEGGETKDETLKTAMRLSSNGIIPMFAYTASESHGLVKSNSSKETYQQLWEKNFVEMINCLELTSEAKEFMAVRPKMTGKVTFLTSSNSLRQLTDIIRWNERVVLDVLGRGDETEIAEFKGLLQNVINNNTDPRSIGNLDSNEYVRTLVHSADLSLQLYDNGEFSELSSSENPKPIQYFQHLDEYLWAKEKLRDIARKASELGVTWILDAEQTYLQWGIDAVTLDLMREFNKKYAVIYNTYQCYLKRTHDVIKRDLIMAKEESFCFAGKVVRGAYIDEERRLAKLNGYADPVNDTYQDTTNMYEQVVNEALHASKTRNPGEVELIIATHNEDTVNEIISQCHALGIPLHGQNLIFTQLLGMRDHIAQTLAHYTLPAAKLVHYGDVEEGIAYLSRRIMENRGGLQTAAQEKMMLRNEIRRRLIRQ